MRLGGSQIAAVAVIVATAAAVGCAKTDRLKFLAISSPGDGALFPEDVVAPVFRWQDSSPADEWTIETTTGDGPAIRATTDQPQWRPTPEQWSSVKCISLDHDLGFSVHGFRDGAALSRGVVTIRTSPDPVGAPIFYRQVPLPFRVAQRKRTNISWRLGFVSSDEPPRTVLEGMHTCANCHSFSAAGGLMAMDLDYGGDKGSYAIAEIGAEVKLDVAQLITWRDYRREDGHRTFGMLSQVSPDGRYVVSTVKETTIMHFTTDPYCTQLFFPLGGILAIYDRIEDRFFALPGADDPAFVQANATWSPDGQWIVFARAPAHDFGASLPKGESIVPRHLAEPFLDGRLNFSYDLYRIPFNEGQGGQATPLEGAAENGRSNYFARYSPDGRWIVFCQASGFMFNRPDSDLHIVPSTGGKARRLDCSHPERMDSWHSFSPNGRWLVFSSKANGPFTQLWLTHIDDDGRTTPPVVLEHFTPPDRAANLPEFVNIGPEKLQAMVVSSDLRGEPETP